MGSWEHKVHTKVSDNAYKLLDDTSSNVMFFCSLCCLKVLSALSNYGSTNVNFDNRLREMETKLSNIVDDINTKLDNHYKKLEAKFTCQTDDSMDSNGPPNTNTISSESVVSLTASLVAEQKEREKRELNLVLHNIPESTASDSPTRKQEDIAQVNSILNEYVDVKPVINNAIRLGKKVTDKSCLLKIIVGCGGIWLQLGVLLGVFFN